MARYLIFVTSVISNENSFCPKILVGTVVGAVEGASETDEVVSGKGTVGLGFTSVGAVGVVPVMNGWHPGGGPVDSWASCFLFMPSTCSLDVISLAAKENLKYFPKQSKQQPREYRL